MATKKKTAATALEEDEPTLSFCDAAAFDAWLEKHHASSKGLLLKLAKQGAFPSITYAEAVEVALAWGWIDGQKRALDEEAWIQRFTPRGARSIWSKVNRAKVERMTEEGRMRAPGLAAVARAKENGAWERAYDAPSTATVPDDLAAALAKDRAAKKAFDGLDAANRYAILWRVQTAKKPETRAKRVTDLVAMLARGDVLHPKRTAATTKTTKPKPKPKARADGPRRARGEAGGRRRPRRRATRRRSRLVARRRGAAAARR